MQYRSMRRAGLKVSEIGLGCEHLQGQPPEVVAQVIDTALAGGVNLIEIFNSEPQVRSAVGEALAGRRDQVLIQGHIGSTWKGGQYERSRDLDACKRHIEDLLTRLQTDHLELGALHYVDEEEDWRAVLEGPLARYARQLREEGVIRAISFSSHDPLVALEAAQSGLIDAMLFSLNPAWDLIPNHHLFTEEGMAQPAVNLTMNPDRARLYEQCELLGVGILVMKALGAGTLLSAQSSPFHRTLTPVQCIGWALSRPAVASVTIGAKNAEEMRQALAYEEADDGERDAMAVISAVDAFSAMRGTCMYCNHCLPCPQAIDVAAVGRLLDLALASGAAPESVAGHYASLSRKAGDCAACGDCESRCPFGVAVRERMSQALAIFGQ